MPAVTSSTVRMEGMQGLQRAFKLADDKAHRELKARFAAAAEPVARTAEGLALSGIRNMTLPWSEMRIGVTQKAVYLAPQKRGTRVASRKRPNLAPLLLERSMVPALYQNEDKIVASIDDLLQDIGRAWEKA